MPNPILQVMPKEHNFLELNEVLEKKVQSLMVELDSVISHQEDVMVKQKCLSNLLPEEGKYQLTGRENLSRTEEEKLRSGVESSTIKKSGNGEKSKSDLEYSDDNSDAKGKKKFEANKVIIRFLKAQVVKLQADLQAIQYELKKKTDQCVELEKVIKKTEEKQEKFNSEITFQKDLTTKTEILNLELKSKINTQNSEIIQLKKEIEALKKELKTVNQHSSNVDVRLCRSIEENEKLRSTLKLCQAEAKDLREQVRKIHEEKRIALKNSEKQRLEMFQAFKKQAQLIDNIKKQKACLEASAEIKFIEEDFVKLMDWKPDAGVG